MFRNSTQFLSEYGSLVRSAVSTLSIGLASSNHSSLSNIILSSHCSVHERESEIVGSVTDLLAWNIVAIWMTGVVTGNLSAWASIKEAVDWFFVDYSNEIPTNLLPTRESNEAGTILIKKFDVEECYRQLPYLLDPHGPGSRLSVIRNPNTLSARIRKRADGVYYTPSDLADFMVRNCLNSLEPQKLPTVLDPSCGTGVYLRSTLSELSGRFEKYDLFQIASKCLFGTDIASWPLDATSYVLLADILVGDSIANHNPWETWRKLRLNLKCVNTLVLDPTNPQDTEIHKENKSGGSRISMSDLFPGIQEEPTVIIGNPPYADLGSSLYVDGLLEEFKTVRVNPRPSAEIYIAFVEQMTRLANRNRFSGAVVLPLSIATNIGSQFVCIRQLIQKTAGHWRFAFFDREPQALFGEDVKTRNAVVFWSRDSSYTQSVISSSPLYRWRGKDRKALFNGIQFNRISCDIVGGIPKINSQKQATAYRTLDLRLERLEHAIVSFTRLKTSESFNSGKRTVFVGTTAYNFLNVFLSPPQTVFDHDCEYSENPLYELTCATSKDALAVYAILTSHLAYWWWHTLGDGFHVTKRFLQNFPFGADLLTENTTDVLAQSGMALWSNTKSNPTLSLNRNKVSIAFDHTAFAELRRTVDKVMVDSAELDHSIVDELQLFCNHMIAAKPMTVATN